MKMKKIRNMIVGGALGALTGGIGGYLYGVRQERNEMAAVVEQPEVTKEMTAALEAAEAVAETATPQA